MSTNSSLGSGCSSSSARYGGTSARSRCACSPPSPRRHRRSAASAIRGSDAARRPPASRHDRARPSRVLPRSRSLRHRELRPPDTDHVPPANHHAETLQSAQDRIAHPRRACNTTRARCTQRITVLGLVATSETAGARAASAGACSYVSPAGHAKLVSAGRARDACRGRGAGVSRFPARGTAAASRVEPSSRRRCASAWKPEANRFGADRESLRSTGLRHVLQSPRARAIHQPE